MPQVASSVGVQQFVVPGSTVENSRGALDLALRKPNVCVIIFAVVENGVPGFDNWMQ